MHFFLKTYYESKSLIAVQRTFVNKHNVKNAPSRKSILAAVKNFEKNDFYLGWAHDPIGSIIFSDRSKF